MTNKIDINKTQTLADYIRYLSAMSIQKANSGHPGLPLGCAEFGATLYQYFLRTTSENGGWLNRDRFVLSAGHGSMFIYSLNYLYGFDFTISDLANFRQFKSKTAGHPEYNHHEGIETTTGPLGQGIAVAVGMAIEEKMLKARFHNAVDYNIYTLLGDGCTMEGISNEAASIAGHHGLDNLIAVYDSNNITIDGNADLAMTEDVKARYKALGWDVFETDGHHIKSVYKILNKLSSQKKGKPKLLVLKTIIGKGTDKMEGSHKSHGAPLGTDEIAYMIQNNSISTFFTQKHGIGTGKEEIKQAVEKELETGSFLSIDDMGDLKSFVNARKNECKTKYENWDKDPSNKALKDFSNIPAFSTLKPELKKELLNFSCDADATRGVSSAVLQIAASHLEQIIGGSADLVGSTKATVKNSQYVKKGDFSGRNLAFGIREHAMGAVGNGLGAGKTFIPFTSTFFTFFDYMKTPVRLAALMKLNHLFVFTHDSIYVGEDGPTHQPVEHTGALRLIPGLFTFRPANDMETAFSYLYFLEHEGPAAILGTRQKLSPAVFKIETDREKAYENFKKGAYIFDDCEGTPDVVLAASGSEVSLAKTVKDSLTQKGKAVRIVSIPSSELFEKQGKNYFNEIMTSEKPVFMIEALSHRSFEQFYDKRIKLLDIESFGISGPAQDVASEFGFTPEKIEEMVLKTI